VRLTDGLLLVSASLHGAAGLFHAQLFRATRLPEHRAFARFAASLCGYILANAVAVAGDGRFELLAGVCIWALGSVAVVALAEMACALVGPPPTVLLPRRLYGAGAVLTSLTVGSVLVFDRDPAAALAGHPAHPVAFAAMAVQSLSTFALLGWSVARLARGSRQRRELRGIVLGFGAAVLIGAFDEVLRWATGARAHLSEHAGLLTVIASTLALADRQVRVASDLSEKSRDLEEAHSLLAQAQHRRGRQEPLAALGELSAVVAHEVRNPLAIVKNAVSSLRRPVLPPEDRETLLEIIGEEAGRLSRLVRDLLAFARPRAATESSIDVRGLVHRAVRDATRGEPSLVSRIEVEVAGSAAVVGDPELLRLALANVVENALHATEAGGKVHVTARDLPADDGAVELAVRDEGHGMPVSVARKARDPFFTTRATGTGLGLAIVERVMRSHGGHLSIESEVGRGSTVALVLPQGAPRSDDEPPLPELT
jgi:signal transduction histidine kinase